MADAGTTRSGPQGGPGRTFRQRPLPDARRLPTPDQEALRLRAIKLLSSGKGKSEVARELGVSRQSVHRWTRISRERGSAALKGGRRGRPGSRPLLPWHEANILRTLVLCPPNMLGLPYQCWTREAIAQLAEKWFGVRLSRFVVGSYLKRWGFSPQRSVRYLFRNTPSRLTHWLGEGASVLDGSLHSGEAQGQ